MPRGVKLETIANVSSELGAVYKRAKAGRMRWEDAAAASLVLHRLRQSLTINKVEERMAERVQAERANGSKAAPNSQRFYRH